MFSGYSFCIIIEFFRGQQGGFLGEEPTDDKNLHHIPGTNFKSHNSSILRLLWLYSPCLPRKSLWKDLWSYNFYSRNEIKRQR